MTDGFTFAASCPRCGGELLPDLERSHHEPDRTWIDARCDVCCDLLRITATVDVVEPWPVDKLDRDARRREGAAYASSILESGGTR